MVNNLITYGGKMPLPKPKSDESREAFLDRCMDNAEMIIEFEDAEQRYAVCISQWDEKKAYDILKQIKEKLGE